jgi:glyoxylase-like metal-dependent hydrolase (beta-lactamase superfamily II)
MTTPAAVAIEDFCEDIVGKAMRGLGLSDSELASTSGMQEKDILAVRRGESKDPAVLRAIAPALGLDAEALVTSAESSWYPEPVSVEGLAMFNTPFGEMRVNAFLVWDPGSQQAAAFDSGADARPLLEFARRHELALEAIYLTHTHPDHVADLVALQTSPIATSEGSRPLPVYCNRREPWNDTVLFEPGSAEGTFAIGSLSIETRETRGHSEGGTTYVIRGLSRPIAVVGDALFAGSQGGGVISYREALRTNREHLFSLSDDTVVCPGHGPMSSIGEEKAHNPFYPEFKG